MLASLRSFVAFVALGLWASMLASASPSPRFTSPLGVQRGDTPYEKRLLRGGSDKIRGVNLGGWFIVEKWMNPTLFAKAKAITGVDASDQYTFMQSFQNQTQAQELLKEHWATFISETDFANIKKLGLNTVRLPVPHWAFSGSSSEPYFALGEQPYIANALKLADKYGLDVLLDLHTAPGSQNGQDHSGRIGAVEFESVNQADNVARFNSALQFLVKTYVNDGQYNGIVKAIEVLNEPACGKLSVDFVINVYKNGIDAMKAVFSPSSKFTPNIVLHDCFVQPLTNWAGQTQNGGNFANQAFFLDTHVYHVFDPWVGRTKAEHVQGIKDAGQIMSDAEQSNSVNRPVVVGEWSLAISCSDCVPDGSTSADIAKLNRQWYQTQTTAFERGNGWIFWSWKAENNLPWSFVDAYNANWIPADITAKNEAL